MTTPEPGDNGSRQPRDQPEQPPRGGLPAHPSGVPAGGTGPWASSAEEDDWTPPGGEAWPPGETPSGVTPPSGPTSTGRPRSSERRDASGEAQQRALTDDPELWASVVDPVPVAHATDEPPPWSTPDTPATTPPIGGGAPPPQQPEPPPAWPRPPEGPHPPPHPGAPTPPYPPGPPLPPPKRDNRLVVILVIVAVLLLCCCGAMVASLFAFGDDTFDQYRDRIGQTVRLDFAN